MRVILILSGTALASLLSPAASDRWPECDLSAWRGQ